MISKHLTADSRYLAYVLRHNPDAIDLRLDDAGWVTVDALLTALAAHGRPLSTDRLNQLVTGLDNLTSSMPWDSLLGSEQGDEPVGHLEERLRFIRDDKSAMLQILQLIKMRNDERAGR